MGKATWFLRQVSEFAESVKDHYVTYPSAEVALADPDPARGKRVFKAEIEYLGVIAMRPTIVAETRSLTDENTDKFKIMKPPGSDII